MTDARNNILTGNIMDYKKKYEEALENLKIIRKANENNNELVDFIEYKYPEIKDSEDDWIKRCIGMCLTDATEQRFEEFNTTLKDCLAWLEKQGEHQEYPKDVIDNATSFLANRNDGMPEEEAKDIVNAIITVLNPSYWPKQVEQKPADKVKPKFKVGDIIINEYGFSIHIDGIDNNMYVYHVLDDNRLLKHDITTNESCHLWTIQDAKDGDILTWDDSNCIIIFSKIKNNESCISHGFIGNIAGVFEKGCGGHSITNHLHPATKEQRDFLFSKMKEAGYEWDAEKKELKKIEQKPAAWSEEDEDIKDTIIRDLKRLGGDIVNVKPAYKAEIDWLESLKQRYTWKPSDEQMEMLENVRKILHSNEDIYSKANNLMYSFEELIRTLMKLREE